VLLRKGNANQVGRDKAKTMRICRSTRNASGEFPTFKFGGRKGVATWNVSARGMALLEYTLTSYRFLTQTDAMADEPDSLILQLLRNIHADMTDVRSEVLDIRENMATKSDLGSLRADLAADFIQFRKEVGDQVAGLRRAVVEYHSSVLGHGVLISDIDTRLRRVEQHLNLPTPDPH
jgi:hypothetical protein